jgi:histidinol-phosphate aminotransferase
MNDGTRSKPAITGLVQPHLLQMPGYEPVEPVDVMARRLGLHPEQISKLDGNENPYGPSPLVKEALAAFRYYHIYPDPGQRTVREAVARYVGVDPEQVLLGNGSDELLDIAGRLFLGPGDVLVNAPPTFGMYEFIGRIHNARIVQAPRRQDFEIDMPALERALGSGAKLLYLASPNNPTGNVLAREHLLRILEYPVAVVVDEAYAEFSGESFVALTAQHDNLIVVRTFSKWAGLAGLRAGYAVLPEALVRLVWTMKIPYNLSVASEQAVLASLHDLPALQANVARLVEERERMAQRLVQLEWLRPYPSRANFLLCEVRGLPAKQVRDQLRARGVLVRYFDSPGLRNCLRISAGRPEDTGRLIAALEAIGAPVRG